MSPKFAVGDDAWIVVTDYKTETSECFACKHKTHTSKRVAKSVPVTVIGRRVTTTEDESGTATTVLYTLRRREIHKAEVWRRVEATPAGEPVVFATEAEAAATIVEVPE